MRIRSGPSLLSAVTALLCISQSLAQVTPPEFSEPAMKQDVFLMEGLDANIECQAAASPKPTYTWWKDDKPLKGRTNAYVQINEETGTLAFKEFSYRENGHYMCVATSEDPFDKSLKATSFSPVQYIRQNYLAPLGGNGSDVTLQEYSYHMVSCNDTKSVGQDITHKWYYGKDSEQITDMDNDRLYIDTKGPPSEEQTSL